MEINFLNLRSVVIFVCLVQGAVFVALLIWRGRREKSRADWWLAALLLLLCASLITPFIGFANVYNHNQWLTYFPFHIAYGYGVCVWLYVVHLTDSKRKIRRKDTLLFIPSIAYLIFRFTLFAQNLEFKDWFDDSYYLPVAAPIIFFTEFVWNVGLLYFSIRHYKKYRAWLDENFSDTEKIKFDWLKNFLYTFTLVLILGAVFDFVNSFVFKLSYVQYFYFELILAFAAYYLAIAGYLRSQTIELNFGETESLKVEETREEKKTLLSESELENLKIKLQNLMQTEKPFLNPQLTLTELSKNLGINSTVLSHTINNGFGKNFNDFINEFRIAEVKDKLQNGDVENSTLLGIAFDCGFNSKATFNRAFKKFTGISPKEFQNSDSF